MTFQQHLMTNGKISLNPLIFDVFHPPRYVVLLALPLARRYLHLGRLGLREQIQARTGVPLIFVLLVYLELLSSLPGAFRDFQRFPPVPRVYLLNLIPRHLAQRRVNLAQRPRHHGAFEGGRLFWVLDAAGGRLVLRGLVGLSLLLPSHLILVFLRQLSLVVGDGLGSSRLKRVRVVRVLVKEGKATCP
jgi:hypothetical protein